MNKIKFFLNSNNDNKKKVVKKIIKDILKNKLKIDFQILTKNIKVNIGETPINELTAKGAWLRAEKIKKEIKDNQSVFIGIESGLVKRYNHWFEECWTYLIYKEKKYAGYSSGLLLPGYIVKKLEEKTHVEIMKELERKNKLSSKDTWGHYTKNLIKRNISFFESFRNTFITFLIDNHLFK